jgi:eukaryotic-like serine/threonine-protein kinase
MATDTLLNRTFDRRYVIRRKLGAGGMADVYLAEDEELGRNVALKMLNDRHARDDQFVERFRREAQSAAGLNHPNIVSIFDRGQAEGTYYIAMEYLDGPTLKELLVKHGKTPIDIAIDYSRQILGALAFAHRHGIVHRDIKPHNIVFGADKRLKVTDFGIARSGTSQMTEAGSIVGTAQYLSPEQARGAPVDPRSDIYSLGIVLYEMLTGRVPFSGDAAVEIAMKHLQEVPVPPSRLRPEVPHELDAVVMRALAKDPDQRYASAEEMDADLARVARGLSVSRKTEEAMTQVLAGVGAATAATVITRPASVTPPPAPPAYRPPSGYYGGYSGPVRRRSFWPWILGLLALVIVAGTAYYGYERVQDQLAKNTPIAVADVGLLQKQLAIQKLQQQGFAVKVVSQPSETVPNGEVFKQDPAGGVKTAQGNPVTIYVSTGRPMVAVPDVRKLNLTEAISKLEQEGLSPDVHDVYSSEAPQTVTAQSPAPNQKVFKDTKVRLNVSQGVRQIGITSVVGMPYANAYSALEGLGFHVVRTDQSSDQPKGEVVNQDPGPGTNAPVGSTVTLAVSTGPAISQVPDVTGDTQQQAIQFLKNAGFGYTVVLQDVTDPSQDNVVLNERPQGGGTLKQGATVTITVGKLTAAPPPATTPATTTTATTTTTPATTTTATTTTTAALPPTPGNDTTPPAGQNTQ